MSLLPAAANRIYLAAAFPARLMFERAARDPQGAQRAILMRIIGDNARTVFGSAHGFGEIRTIADFQARVPLGDADCFAPYFARAAAGETRVLTREPVTAVEPTSGSSGPSKLVPYTSELLEDFAAATLPWTWDLLANRPRLRNGRAYWAITPPARIANRTAGGIPIGLGHDSDYFPAFARVLLDHVLGVPRVLARATDIATSRYLTLRALLALPDLVMISVWSPSFLTLLMEVLDQRFDDLVDDLGRESLAITLDASLSHALSRQLPARPGLANRLRRKFGRKAPEDLGALWPRLALISCWTDGHAALALPGIKRRFPHVEIQGKGLLATEGVVSFPLLATGGCVAAVASHFLELLPQDAPDRPITIERAESDAIYEVVLTTSGGLYRYRLRDLVRVEGFYRRAPVLSFVGRADHASDLVGEKLTPAFVESALAAARHQAGVDPEFAMLAPVWGSPPHYRLFVDAPPPQANRLAQALERQLTRSYHYALCRSLGQLAAIDAAPIDGAARRYEQVCVERGQRAGTIKPVALEARLGWEFDLADVPPSRMTSPPTATRPAATVDAPRTGSAPP